MKTTFGIDYDRVRDHVPVPMVPVMCQGASGVGVAGDTTVCHNLRLCGDRLVAVGEPQQVAVAGRRPVFTDMMDGVTYLFTQEDDGTLYAEPCPQGDPASPPVPVGRVEARIEEGASVGGFVVFRLVDGRLVYVRRDGGAYRWLGELPELPAFSLETETGVAMSVEMEGTRFARPLTDLGNPVPAEVSGKVGQAWRQAWEQLAANMRAAGRWIEPVRVRLALRLWDGSLLRVSDPVRVAPPVRAARDRVEVGLLWDESAKGFTGTAACTVSAHGYTIGLSMDGGLPEEWAGIVAGIEVWVSREPETLSAQRSPRMTFIRGNAGNFVSFVPAARSLADIDAEAETLPMGLLRFFPLDSAAGGRLSNRTDMVWDSGVERYSVPMPGVGASADCILGYGEFLHAGAADTLYTSLRGNPFVLRSMTQGLGGRVRSLRPQRCGGGAFTRQYIYASTDRGVVALCHKADGEHTNSRPVSQEPLGADELWCSTPQGVYALTAGGSLLRLRDAAAPQVFSHLAGVESLLWSNASQELWVCSAGGALVVQGDVVYTRPERYVSLPGVFSPSLACREEDNGLWHVVTLDSEGPATGEARFGCEVPLESGGWLRLVTFLMTGSGISYGLSNGLCGTLCAGREPGQVTSALAVRLPLASAGNRLAPGQRRLAVTLSGKISEIRKIRITG